MAFTLLSIGSGDYLTQGGESAHPLIIEKKMPISECMLLSKDKNNQPLFLYLLCYFQNLS